MSIHGPCLETIEMGRPSSGLATGFHWLRKSLPAFHPRSKIATSPTAILKTTGSSVALASIVDDNEVVGGGGGVAAESGENVGGLDASRLL